jgi:hypothetical protein
MGLYEYTASAARVPRDGQLYIADRRLNLFQSTFASVNCSLKSYGIA